MHPGADDMAPPGSRATAVDTAWSGATIRARPPASPSQFAASAALSHPVLQYSPERYWRAERLAVALDTARGGGRGRLAHIEARRSDPDFRRRLQASIERNREVLERLAR